MVICKEFSISNTSDKPSNIVIANHEGKGSSIADLGKRLLDASRQGLAEEVRLLMISGAPFQTDWVITFVMLNNTVIAH